MNYIKTRQQALEAIKSNKNTRYIYGLTDIRGEIFYIGIGVGNRIFKHLQKTGDTSNKRKLQRINKIGIDNVRFILFGFTEDIKYAELIEKKLIARYRKQLTNIVHVHTKTPKNHEPLTHKYIESLMGVDGMINLATMVNNINAIRLSKGKKARLLQTILISESIQDFIESLKRVKLYREDTIIKVMGKGRNRATYGCLELAVKIAMLLSPEFHYEVISNMVTTLIKGDTPENDFKTLNQYLDNLEDRKSKKNQGVFINVSKIIRLKFFTEEQIKECRDSKINIWNSPFASSEILNKRDDIEKQLISFIKMGFIKTYSEVKEVLERF